MSKRKCPNCDVNGIVPAHHSCSQSPVVDRLKMLTPREWEILEHLLIGDTICQAAHKQGKSYPTVRNQRRSIFNKLEMESETKLLRFFLTCWFGNDLPSSQELCQHFQIGPDSI